MEKILRAQLPGGRFKNVSPGRSRNMAAIKGRDNKTTERRLRLALVRAGVRGWKLRPRELAGCPDFFFPRDKLVVFVDGCFWHGCPSCGHLPKKNRPFWRAKIDRNRARDQSTTERLMGEGYTVLRLWEHQLQTSLASCLDEIRVYLDS